MFYTLLAKSTKKNRAKLMFKKIHKKNTVGKREESKKYT